MKLDLTTIIKIFFVIIMISFFIMMMTLGVLEYKREIKLMERGCPKCDCPETKRVMQPIPIFIKF
jgi:hypothetical protein